MYYDMRTINKTAIDAEKRALENYYLAVAFLSLKSFYERDKLDEAAPDSCTVNYAVKAAKFADVKGVEDGMPLSQVLPRLVDRLLKYGPEMWDPRFRVTVKRLARCLGASIGASRC